MTKNYLNIRITTFKTNWFFKEHVLSVLMVMQVLIMEPYFLENSKI